MDHQQPVRVAGQRDRGDRRAVTVFGPVDLRARDDGEVRERAAGRRRAGSATAAAAAIMRVRRITRQYGGTDDTRGASQRTTDYWAVT